MKSGNCASFKPPVVPRSSISANSGLNVTLKCSSRSTRFDFCHMIDLTHVISNSTNLCERALICVGWLVDQHWMNLLAPSLKKSAWALLVVNPKNVQFIATATRLEQILTDRWRHFQADDSQSIIHIRVIVLFKTDLSVTNDSDTWLIPDDSFLDDSLWM